MDPREHDATTNPPTTEFQRLMDAHVTPPREPLGSDPECICDGDRVTLWDCPCAECRQLAASGSFGD